MTCGAPFLGDVTAVASESSARVRINDGESNLTRYLLLTDIHLGPDGSSIWLGAGGAFDGRVHTNGELRFVGVSSFGDTVSSGNMKAWFYNNGNPRELAADHNDTTDVPVFHKGFVRGAASVPLPSDSYDQQKLTLGLAADGAPPTNAMIRSSLGFQPDSVPPPNGIYVVSSMGRMVGGLYVQGDADRVLATADTIVNRQSYQVTQGLAVKTITIDPEAITTSVTVGMTTTVYQGLPCGELFVNGAVADFRGPDRVGPDVTPALLDGQRLLLVATGDIVIQNDVTVRHFDTGTAVIGIFSSSGKVRIGVGAPNDLSLDAFVMALGPNGTFSVDNYGSGTQRGAVHLRGGCVSTYFGSFGSFQADGAIRSGYGRDFRHDDRGLVPPGYPTAPLPVAGVAQSASAAPNSVNLSLAGPNPARGTLRARYTLVRPGHVHLTLFDVLGRRVATLLDADRPAGANEVSWSIDRSPERIRPGLYLLSLDFLGSVASVRVVVIQ